MLVQAFRRVAPASGVTGPACAPRLVQRERFSPLARGAERGSIGGAQRPTELPSLVAPMQARHSLSECSFTCFFLLDSLISRDWSGP